MSAIYGTLDRAIIPRASSSLTSLNQIGGSLGTAVLAIILQANLADLPEAPASGYAHTFWWVLGFCLVAALVALTLARHAPNAEGQDTDNADG